MYIRHVMLKNNKNDAETVERISCVFGQGVINDSPGRNWFSKFCSGDTQLRNEPRPRCSSELDQNALRELIECNRRIYSDKSSFKTEKGPISQEYHCRWRKLGLLRQCSMQKEVDWQRWISVAYSKDGASCEKNYSLCMVRSLWYYSFWVFKPHLDN